MATQFYPFFAITLLMKKIRNNKWVLSNSCYCFAFAKYFISGPAYIGLTYHYHRNHQVPYLVTLLIPAAISSGAAWKLAIVTVAW